MGTGNLKPAGKPEAGATAQVRIFSDLAAKIAEIADVTKQSTAQVCDLLMRAEADELWEQGF